MALLGTFIDVITASLGGGSYAAQTYGTLQHSLGQAPDFVVMQVQSIGSATAAPGPLAMGGNGSIATFGAAGPVVNGASQPIIGFKAICFKAHSQIA